MRKWIDLIISLSCAAFVYALLNFMFDRGFVITDANIYGLSGILVGWYWWCYRKS